MGRKRVLILEDDRDIRALLRCGMEIEGHEVVAVGNGLEGIHQLEQGFLPDLIVLDLMMPVLSGPEFLNRRAKKPEYSSIPVVVISASREIEQVIAPHSVQGRLTKPFALSELSEIAHKIWATGAQKGVA